MYLEIEKRIFCPPRDRTRSGKWKTMFAQMKVGDSFLVSEIRQAISACNSAKRFGYRTTMRRMKDGYRVWKLSGLK